MTSSQDTTRTSGSSERAGSRFSFAGISGIIAGPAILAIAILAPESSAGLVCDVGEGLGAFHWAEPATGQGSLEIAPEEPVVAGSSATWTITYIAGPAGLPPGAGVELVTPRGCSAPAPGDASRPSSITASTASESSLKLRVIPKEGRRFPGTRVAAVIGPKGLEPGGRVIFTWRRAAVTREIHNLEDAFLEFYVLARRNPDELAELLPKMAKVRLLPEEASGLDVFARSTAVVGEPTRVTLRVRDKFRNPAMGYRGTVRLSWSEGADTASLNYTFTETDRGAHTFDDIVFQSEGTKFVRVEDANAGFSAASDPVEVHARPPDMRLCWGDIHVHTTMSWDAWFGAQSVVTYGGAYKMGRDFAGLDFQANTDHDAPNPYTAEIWAEMGKITNSFNQPGRFVTMLAIENSGPTGDKNVYWRGAEAPYIVAEKGDPIALFKKLRGLEVLVIPHHVAQSMRPTDWRREYFDPEHERLLEIFSNHGRAEFFGNMPHFSHHPVPTLKGYSYQDALARGYRLGVVAASDNHTGEVASAGLTGVWAAAHTREAIYDAMKARRCYGTTNPRIIVRFAANGRQMGEEFADGGPITVKGSAVGSAKMLSIEVVKNGETPFVAYPDQRTKIWDHGDKAKQISFEWVDRDFQEDSYYYLRVTQAPTREAEDKWGFPPQMDFAWSSPVWVTYKVP